MSREWTENGKEMILCAEMHESDKLTKMVENKQKNCIYKIFFVPLQREKIKNTRKNTRT